MSITRYYTTRVLVWWNSVVLIGNVGIVICEVVREDYWWVALNGTIALILGGWLFWTYLDRKRKNDV